MRRVSTTNYRATSIACFAIVIGACSRYELPTVPDPLDNYAWQGSPVMDEQPMADGRPLHGALSITGEISQVALNGPPLRLRVQLDIDAKADGKLEIVSKTVTPSNLASKLQLPDGKLASDSIGWPIAALERLHQPQRLAEWLNRPTEVGGCKPERMKNPSFKFTTGTLEGGHLHRYQTKSLDPDSRRNEIGGYVRQGPDGSVQELQVKIRRWARLTGDACNMVQEERISISSRKVH